MPGQFKYLFSPLKIGAVTVPNRIVFSAHLTNFAEGSLPSDRHAYYYAERAKGGAGLIITEEQSVHRTDFAYEKLIHAFDERVIPRYRTITGMVHKYSAKIFAQINHNGGQGSGVYSRLPLWAPSPIADPLFREVPKEMEPEDMREVVGGFALAARHVKEGGFDGIELQASHSSLIRQFFSPQANRRTDSYGGSLDNRMRFCNEIIDAIKEAVGCDFALGIRLCGDELIEGGLTLEETVEIARNLASTGKIDYINTSIGTATHTLFMVDGSMHTPPGYQLYISSAIRKAVDLPVFCVGRIKDPVQAERILAEGHADMVGMVRAQICDPEFANKAREGRLEAIKVCLSCNQYCIGRLGLNLPLGCIQSPAAGKERELGIGTLRPAPRRKRVVVVGGGPGGMEAARMAALRGHDVILYEKENELGGQVNIIVKVPNRVEFGDLIRNLRQELEALKVKVKLGTEVTADTVEAEKPDAVVLATGSLPAPSSIPISDGAQVVEARQVLRGEVEVGQRVVLIDEVGFHEATSTAEFLADRGRQVEIVTSALYCGQDLGLTLDLEMWHRRARAKGIAITPNVVVRDISGNTVTVFNHYSGHEWHIEGVDTVVRAAPGRANDALYFALKGRVRELYRVGDCVAPRRVALAILEGHLVARSL
ncbi:MAG: mycofactocin system FadH/OYE family oxidoreductase 2 [Dehalococcoidia bacterium]